MFQRLSLKNKGISADGMSEGQTKGYPERSKEDGLPNISVWHTVMQKGGSVLGYSTFTMGTLYLNSVPQKTHSVREAWSFEGYNTFSIGNTEHKCALKWVNPDGMNVLVANRTLVSHVSWDTLNSPGFDYVNGHEILIDDLPFLCRMPYLGYAENDDSEWTRILEASGTDDNKVWNWGIEAFFGAEECTYEADYLRPSRGINGALGWFVCSHSRAYQTTGFRPLLEPLPLDPNEHNLGKLIELEGQQFYCSQGSLNTDYFYPELLPVKTSTDGSILFDLNTIGGWRDGSVSCRISMYSLLMDGKPVPQRYGQAPSYKKGSVIELTDKFFGEEYLITWSVGNGVAYPVHRLLQDVDRDVLTEQGFIRKG